MTKKKLVLAMCAATFIAASNAFAEDDAPAPASATEGIHFDHDAEAAAIQVFIRGEHFTTYHYGDSRHFPFLWPVNAEGGVGVTRNFPMGSDTPSVRDHPHHLSLYLTYGELNGYDFWHAGFRRSGVIRTAEIESGQGDGYGYIRSRKHWLGGEDQVFVMEEERELRFYDGEPSARRFDFISTFKATQGDVTFGDTKEAMLAIRIRPEIDGKRGGVLTNADGFQGESEVYGRPSPWMDYTGKIEGLGLRGIALFDHPSNFRPAQWHVRDYGLAALSPFATKSVAQPAGEDGQYTLPKGETLTFRYGFLVHSGDHEQANVAGHYQDFLRNHQQ
jgi:hypothetical protein